MTAMVEKIKSKWEGYPVKLNILEIEYRKELPKVDKCGKDELWIGVKRALNKDTVYVIRQDLEMVFRLKCSFEQLTDKDLEFMQIYPKENQYCKICGEFSARIDKHGICYECMHKKGGGKTVESKA